MNHKRGRALATPLYSPKYNISSDRVIGVGFRCNFYYGTRNIFTGFGIYHGERNHTALGLRPSQTYRTQEYK